MQVCSRCLYTSAHPLHLTFDEEGVCSGCRVHEEKDQLDWAARAGKLRQLLEGYRNRSGNNYDCVIPVSGARDSYFIVHTIKNVYGLNPLLVTYNKQYNTAIGVRNLANLRIRLDCDIMTQTVNPETVKKITRGTLRRFGSIYWHCLAGQTVFPVQIAVKFKIPLIIWGAHQGVDQVGMFSHLDEVEMTRKYRKEHDLMGYEAEDLVDDFDGISEQDMMPFAYPDNRELERVGIRGIYLNNYIRWDSRAQHEQMMPLYGYESGTQTRTFDTYNDVDCWNYSDTHDYIKYLKHGYGKVVDHACREIRLGRLSRTDALALVRRYVHRPPRHLSHFLSWLGITENAFHYLIDQHRSPAIWARNQEWEWEMIHPTLRTLLGVGLVDNGNKLRGDDFWQIGPNRSSDREDGYILIGKGI
ncbi:N-acetyl sugar amidotransferase [Laribacter hongkongensis]|uniref:N-acetyl sugar amidotransferase n=1 Tax=Laribacter hongkongensis TaxID=168471 RepID=UPI001EFC35BC|nr:N-acetyl sugar amidotransferase [Laribacter hongkongensis]MCG9094388.1 N-acetyl sugar amidotransferase [Laribacter hongkongensis]